MRIAITGVPDQSDIIIEDAERFSLVAETGGDIIHTAYGNVSFLVVAALILRAKASEAVRAEVDALTGGDEANVQQPAGVQ